MVPAYAWFRALEASSVDDGLAELKEKMALKSAESETLYLEAARN